MTQWLVWAKAWLHHCKAERVDHTIYCILELIKRTVHVLNQTAHSWQGLQCTIGFIMLLLPIESQWDTEPQCDQKLPYWHWSKLHVEALILLIIPVCPPASLTCYGTLANHIRDKRCHMCTIKQLKLRFLCVLLDLSLPNSGGVTTNSTLILQPCVLVLVTRLEAHTDTCKSNNIYIYLGPCFSYYLPVEISAWVYLKFIINYCRVCTFQFYCGTFVIIHY